MYLNKKSRTQRFIRSLDLPKDLPWKVLSALQADLQQFLPERIDADLTRLIRERDSVALVEWGKNNGLQSMVVTHKHESLTSQRCVLAVGALLAKYPWPGDRLSRESKAMAAVYAAEEQCSEFNRLGWKRLHNDARMGRIVERAKTIVQDILGPLLPDTAQLMQHARHGPGCNTQCRYGYTSCYDKQLDWPYHVTSAAREHAIALIRCDERHLGALEESYRRKYGIPPWAILNQDVFWSEVLLVVEGNKITTVPKDGLTDRPIAIEPSMNVQLQLGVHGFIASRIRRYGLNIHSQYTNQARAYWGSMSTSAWAPSTLDMKSASDTVSLRLCKLLLPSAWYIYLTELRSPVGVTPDKRRLRYSKLSSMGNGYTFAIELVLFYAIALATVREQVRSAPRASVHAFGDDLLVPNWAARTVSWSLEALGLRLNDAKSFVYTDVKESCGADWIRGHYVRPVYITSALTGLNDILSVRNRLNRWFCTQIYSGINHKLENVDALLKRYIPHELDGLVGPLSDQEFDQWWHSEESSHVCADGRYRFTAVTSSRKKRKVKRSEFLFGKLLLDLRPKSSTGYGDWTSFLFLNNGTGEVSPPGKPQPLRARTQCHWKWQREYTGVDTPADIRRLG